MAKNTRKLSRGHDGIVITPRDGKTMARVWMSDGAGGGKYKSKRFSTVQAAEGWAQDQVAKLRTGAETSGTGKVADLKKLYLEQMELRGAGETHRTQVARMFALLAECGANDLRDPGFETKVLRAVVAHQSRRKGQITAAPASSGYQRKLLSMAKSFARWAAERRYIGYNPLAGARLAKPTRTSKQTWSLDELKILVSDAARHNLSRNFGLTVDAIARHGGDKHAAAATLGVHVATVYNRLNAENPGDDPLWLSTVLGLYTGARPSECRAMTWGMIDWSTADLVLPATTPGNKTRTERRIRLMDELQEIIKPMAAVGSAGIVAASIAAMTESTYSNAFRAYCGRLGVTPLGPHTLRHCCGSLMTAMGMQPVLVLLQLGHDSPIVSKRYSESAPKFRAAKDWGDQFGLRDKQAQLAVPTTKGKVERIIR